MMRKHYYSLYLSLYFIDESKNLFLIFALIGILDILIVLCSYSLPCDRVSMTILRCSCLQVSEGVCWCLQVSEGV